MSTEPRLSATPKSWDSPYLVSFVYPLPSEESTSDQSRSECARQCTQPGCTNEGSRHPHSERLAAVRIPLGKRWASGNPNGACLAIRQPERAGVWQPSGNPNSGSNGGERWVSGSRNGGCLATCSKRPRRRGPLSSKSIQARVRFAQPTAPAHAPAGGYPPRHQCVNQTATASLVGRRRNSR
jgi:hypothetical protein